jgi:hypothetical protein
MRRTSAAVSDLLESRGMTDRPVQEAARRPPLGGFVVAAVQLVRAVLLVGQMVGFGLGSDSDWLRVAVQIPEPAPDTLAFAISRLIGIGLVAASVLSAIGLLRARRWAWVAAILISGLSLAFALGEWWDGRPAYVSMLLNTIVVFYLNQRDVRAVYDRENFGEPEDRS